MLRVGQVMSRLSVCLYGYNTIGDALALMKEKKVTGLPLINEQGHLLGMVTKDQILENNIEELSVDNKAINYLTTRFIPLKEEALLEDVWDLPFDIYPVLNNHEELIGIVTKYALGNAFFQEVQLRRHELEAVFDSAHNGILAINKQGIITSLNPAAEKPTRSSKEEAVGRFLTDVIVPTGLLEVVRTGIPEFGVKFQLGRRQYITNRSPIIKDGEVIGAVGVFQDVSEIEKSLQELRSVKQLNEELRTIVNSSFNGIIICNSQGEILRCNPAVESILKISKEDLIGMTFKDFVDNGIFQKNIIHLVKKQDRSVSILERPYAEHALSITGNPVYDEEGEMTKIIINIRDMSELLTLQEALEESKQFSERYQAEIVQLRNNVESGVILQSRSVIMKNVLDLAARVSQVDSPIVLVGELGVGKKKIAKLIHNQSERRTEPFYELNCGSLPEHLLEIQLFGQESSLEKGKKGKAGLLQLANQGSLYLEEIGEMSLGLQTRLLRALQDKFFRSPNGEENITLNIRIMVGTTRSLIGLVEQGIFKEELFFSLNVVPIKIPALRERKEDIIPLVYYYLGKNNKRYGIQKEFSPDAVQLLLNYQWPGNVRELVNLVERLAVTANGKLISAKEVNEVFNEKELSPIRSVTVTSVVPLKEAMDDLEQQLVTLAMEQHGTTVRAAEALGVNQSTVVRKLKKLKGPNMSK